MPILIRFLQRLGILKRISFDWKLIRGSGRFFIPVHNGQGINNLVDSEPWMTSLIRTIFKLQDGAFMDVGMNTGQTLLRVKGIYPRVKYVGFEPNASCVSYLKRLIRLNRFENVVLVPVAICGINGVLKLSSFEGDDDTDSSATIVKNFRPGSAVTHADWVSGYKFESLQNVFDFSTVAIVKIDVEGAESLVLSELHSLLISSRPFVIVEILPVYNNENLARLHRQEQIEYQIGKVAYSLFRVLKNHASELASLQELRKIGVHSDLALCEYLLCPNEHKAGFLQLIGNPKTDVEGLST